MTQNKLQAFLGLTGYCRIWIPNYGLIAQPLYESLKGQDDSIPLMWGTPQKKAAAAAAMSLQSCPTLCDPIDSSPPGSPVPGILQARTLEWVAIAFLLLIKLQMLSRYLFLEIALHSKQDVYI